MLSREWRYSWSSADRRCSNYIWVINNLIAFLSASYIRDLTVLHKHSESIVDRYKSLKSRFFLRGSLATYCTYRYDYLVKHWVLLRHGIYSIKYVPRQMMTNLYIRFPKFTCTTQSLKTIIESGTNIFKVICYLCSVYKSKMTYVNRKILIYTTSITPYYSLIYTTYVTNNNALCICALTLPSSASCLN